MQTDNKFYTIIAGRKEPAQVEYGTLNKATGLPNTNTVKGSVALGKILVLNYSAVWGKRVAEPSDPKVKIPEDSKVAVTDPHYKGKVEFMKWGAAGGEVIEVRFLPHSNSLDKQYQDAVQKLRVDDERDIYIKLEQGLNDFDYKTQSLLIQMLKIHSFNNDSESRNPSVQDFDYAEYSATSRTKKKETIILARGEAEATLFGARDIEGGLSVLANAFGMEARLQDEVIFERLLDKTQAEPVEFLDTIANYGNGVFLTLKDAIDAELIHVANGKLKLAGSNGKDTDILSVEAEEEKAILLELVNRALNPEVFQAIATVQAALNAYKKEKLS